jgi:hypothetical protein
MAGSKKAKQNGQQQQAKKSRKKSKGQQAVNPAQQSARDSAKAQKRALAPKYSGLKMSAMDGRAISESDFIKMTLDPCHGPLTTSPFGKTENSYIWRLNYRSTVTSNASGNLMAALYPKGMFNAFGSGAANYPQCLQLWNGSGVTDSGAGTSSTASVFPGTLALEGIAAQLRVTAGCIKLNYIGPAQTAQGQLWAWEGQGDENFASVAAAQTMVARQSPNGFMMNGMTAPVMQGVEAMLNYAKVATDDQYKFADIQVFTSDVYCPFAAVGVSGGPATTNYVLEATVIVEWTPLLSQGVPAPSAAMVKPGAAERVANALRSVAPLLVKAAGLPLGGYASMVGKAVSFGAQVYNALRA